VRVKRAAIALLSVLTALAFGLFHGLAPRPIPESSRPPAPAARAGLPLAGVLIILDPGHGGEDSGASKGLATPEAALTYRTALELAQCLRASGATVIFTVQSKELSPAFFDTEPPPQWPQDAVLSGTGRRLMARRRCSPVQLWERAEVAHRAWAGRAKTPGAQDKMAFLSLHYDFSSDPMRQGGHVYVDSRLRLQPRLATILERRMAQAGLMGEGSEAAMSQVSARELGVLNPQFNPVRESLLIEIATLSNWNDAINAGDAQWRRQFCWLVTDALIELFSQTAH